jgi:LacI family transcriptional regulator
MARKGTVRTGVSKRAIAARGARAARPQAAAPPSAARSSRARVDSSGVATIRDVARVAGVSVATVSRVLNGSAPVSESTDTQVRNAARDLNYWPNGAARSLITRSSNTLGVLLPDIHGEFFSEVIRGIDLAARGEGYHLLVSSSNPATDELVSALGSMRGRIDGLIVMMPDQSAPRLLRECAAGTPTVVLNAGAEVPGCHAISIDNHDGAYRVVRHLVSVGRRRIATITGPRGNTDARLRLEGYLAALRDAGLNADPKYLLQGEFTEPSGYEAGLRLLQLDPRPDAVFVGNDRMAVGVMGAFHDSGVDVPGEIAIAGFDDIEMSQYLSPALTTVHADAQRLGALAVSRLLELQRTSKVDGPRHEVLPTTLVVRGSCGALDVDSANARIHRNDIQTPSESARRDRR